MKNLIEKSCLFDYVEDYQKLDIRYSLAVKNEDDNYEELYFNFFCRDYFNEVLLADKIGRCKVYGFYPKYSMDKDKYIIVKFGYYDTLSPDHIIESADKLVKSISDFEKRLFNECSTYEFISCEDMPACLAIKPIENWTINTVLFSLYTLFFRLVPYYYNRREEQVSIEEIYNFYISNDTEKSKELNATENRFLNYLNNIPLNISELVELIMSLPKDILKNPGRYTYEEFKDKYEYFEYNDVHNFSGINTLLLGLEIFLNEEEFDPDYIDECVYLEQLIQSLTEEIRKMDNE